MTSTTPFAGTVVVTTVCQVPFNALARCNSWTEPGMLLKRRVQFKDRSVAIGTTPLSGRSIKRPVGTDDQTRGAESVHSRSREPV